MWGSSRRSRADTGRDGPEESAAVTATTGLGRPPAVISRAARAALIRESPVARQVRTSTGRPVKTPPSVAPSATATVLVATPPATPATIGRRRSSGVRMVLVPVDIPLLASWT
ncbi:MAG: hypothetical protein BGP03_20620 [Pseudonocardia sp. 73-21]|nr:MAG: hypothetical protein BGP03_20620 [Pseudonocardia sp. 73-21]